MPVRKPSYSSRSFSRVTRTPKRTISCSVSVKVKTIKTTKKSQLAHNKNFLSPVIQKNNSLLLLRRRLPDCGAGKQVRTKARISANNGSYNCTIIRASSCGSRIKWLDRIRTTRSVQCFKFEPQWKLCANLHKRNRPFPHSAKARRREEYLKPRTRICDLRKPPSFTKDPHTVLKSIIQQAEE